MKIGIIGGTGVYDPNILTNVKKERVKTKYGDPSDLITTGNLGGIEVAVLPRHGSQHTFNPSSVNYRANIYALKKIGVTEIISVSAVGSLKENYKPGDLVLVDQCIDLTKKRKNTFYDGKKVCHISVAEPTCKNLGKILEEESAKLNLKVHNKGTCVVIEGPRYSTKAESIVYKSWDADIIGMTMAPECFLAREAEICYATVALVTDYDVWKEGHVVSTDEVKATMKKNLENVRLLLKTAIPKMTDYDCSCKHALEGAFI